MRREVAIVGAVVLLAGCDPVEGGACAVDDEKACFEGVPDDLVAWQCLDGRWQSRFTCWCDADGATQCDEAIGFTGVSRAGSRPVAGARPRLSTRDARRARV